MKGVKSIPSLSYGAIVCNTSLLGILCFYTDFSNRTDLIAISIAGFGIITSILYAAQLILMNRAYYRHHVIRNSSKVLLHICRIIQLLYSIAEACMLGTGVYYLFRDRAVIKSYDFKSMILTATFLMTVVMNFTIFFKGWRLLKMVRKPYIDVVMASFD